MPMISPPNMPSRFAILLVAFLLALPMPALAAEEDYTDAYRRLVDERSPSVVPVKYVITVAAGGQEQRNEDRTQGVLVAADGLVLVSARAVSFDLGSLNRQEPSPGGAMVAKLDGADAPALLAALDVAKSKSPDLAVLLVSPDAEAGKVAIAARVPQSLIAKGLKAGDWVKAAAQACGGSGGGKPDMAQAGGKDVTKVDDAIAAAKALAAKAG